MAVLLDSSTATTLDNAEQTLAQFAVVSRDMTMDKLTAALIGVVQAKKTAKRKL